MERQEDRGIESQETDRDRADIHGDRQRNKQLEVQTDGETGRQRDIQSRDRQRGSRHTWGQTKKQTARETDRWRDRQTEG